mgnify:CR=1 FL=1
MQHRAGFYEKYVKRLLDLVLSGLALIILSPLLLGAAILVRVKLGSPVIFCQERPGTANCCRMRSGSRRLAAACAARRSTSCRSCGISSGAR